MARMRLSPGKTCMLRSNIGDGCARLKQLLTGYIDVDIACSRHAYVNPSAFINATAIISISHLIIHDEIAQSVTPKPQLPVVPGMI